MDDTTVDPYHDDTITENAAIATDMTIPEPLPTNVDATDEATALAGLTEDVRDQDELERDITYQANLAMIEKEDELDEKRIDKVKVKRDELARRREKRRESQDRLGRSGTNLLVRNRYQTEIDNIDAEIVSLDQDMVQIRERIEKRHQVEATDSGAMDDKNSGNKRMPNESRRDFLIRTGKITPFSKITALDFEGTNGGLDEVLLGAEADAEIVEPDEETNAPKSHQNLRMPGFANAVVDTNMPADADSKLRVTKKRRNASGNDVASTIMLDDELPSTGHAQKQPSGANATSSRKRLSVALGTSADGESWDKKRRLSDGRSMSSARASDDESLSTPLAQKRKAGISAEIDFGLRPTKQRRLASGSTANSARNSDDDSPSTPPASKRSPGQDSGASFTSPITESNQSEFEDDDDVEFLAAEGGITQPRSRSKKAIEKKEDLSGLDDGNEKNYQARLQDWVERRSSARLQVQQQAQEVNGAEHINNDAVENDEEWFRPAPNEPDHEFKDGLKLPGDIYPALFDYQKTGVQWLGELYNQQVGGILGDEMGLGKTIQVISFIAALHYSKKLTKPIIVVAPATVLKQWVNEFHRWWPPLRVSILHSSGSGMLNVRSEEQMEDKVGGKKSSKTHKAAKRIVDRVVQHGHVLVTTYAGLQTYGNLLVPIDWNYAVLDEGHKIRNPNAAVTIYSKELHTPNRLILSGTPMQNNVIELWSLFDFVYPMRLGTLVNFRQQFEIPIKIGGYASATNLQIMTAEKCAETLKEAISPYLMQRLKSDVAADLPEKSEKVLFCKLTKTQREAYEIYLASDQIKLIMDGRKNKLDGIRLLREICNHPDIPEENILRTRPGYKFGNPVKSGKMQVIKALLEMWKGQGHKALLFSQSRKMLNIIEQAIKDYNGFNYLRMDGETNISSRQEMVDRFNKEPDLHVFLLTTKVGGLGVNLTGANRVIIVDPDWNPSTDIQARERAWRLGQKKDVAIFRLVTAGTIEEKIYHRQIYKQFLTNKVMKDPKQRKTFEMKDLYDLFSLGSHDEKDTETGQMFKATEVKFEAEPSDEKPQTQRKGSIDGIRWGGQTQIPYPEDDEGEIREMAGVAKLENYQNTAEEEKNASTDETRLLSGIFARSGVHSALEHDEIINGKKKVTANRGMLEREAKRVAEEAARDLRKAAEVAKNVPIGTVTWTGEKGEAGRPQNRRAGGPSSLGVLGNLADRQGLSGSPGSSRGSTPSTSASARPKDKEFLRLIHEYIIRQGGIVPSQMLVVHFNSKCRTAADKATFMAMLDQVAVLKRGTGGRLRGKWELRDEYKKKD